MNWLITSAITSLLVTSGPLVLAESALRAKDASSTRFAEQRTRLVVATAVVWIAFALWFWRDHGAIAAGQRPFAVALAALAAFLVLLFGFAMPAIASLGTTSSTRAIPPSPVAVRQTHLAVALGGLAVTLAYATGRSDIGHQIKAAVILLGAVGLYAFEVQRLRQSRPIRSALGTSSLRRAMVVFCVFVTAALLTLLLDWNVAWQGWLGVGSQWAVGIIGFVQCAGILSSSPSTT